MHQRIAVHAFKRGAGQQRAVARHIEQGGALDQQERPQPLACARYNTKVFTDKGIFDIGEIVDNNRTDLKVFDGNQFVPVLATKNNGLRSVYRATLRNGNFIEFTDDHLVWNADKRSKDGGEYFWGQMKTLVGKKVQQFSLASVTPELALVEEMAAEMEGGSDPWAPGFNLRKLFHQSF